MIRALGAMRYVRAMVKPSVVAARGPACYGVIVVMSYCHQRFCHLFAGHKIDRLDVQVARKLCLCRGVPKAVEALRDLWIDQP